MQLMIFGPGRLGQAIAGAAVAAGWPAPIVVGRPAGSAAFQPDDTSTASRLPARPVDVVIDASGGHAIAVNVADALAAGHRAFVLAATGWDADQAMVRSMLLEHDAAAVVAPNLSLGAALFGRLVEVAAGWYGRAAEFEPSIVEWHRRGKADRPSGTARALARRVVSADPRWTTGGATDDPRPALEVVGIRSGAAPGTHLVTFDGPGESVELRLTARDRSAYADGALAAARWLVADTRAPGLHPFDAVVDHLLAATPLALPA